ncbi:MAG: histone family protein [Candidatus Jordarchaeaceae archaeon]
MPRKKNETVIPVAPVDRLIRLAGADRVSESGAAALAKILEELGLEIARLAEEMAKHTGRKTIREEDINLAYKTWKKTKYP